MSRQAFPRKIGKKVRGVSEIHGYCIIPYTCHVCGILALGVAGTHNRLCIMGYKYKNAAGKNDYLNWLARRVSTHTYLANFRLKKAFARMGKWSAISTSPAWKYTCPGLPGNRFFGPWLICQIIIIQICHYMMIDKSPSTIDSNRPIAWWCQKSKQTRHTLHCGIYRGLLSDNIVIIPPF